MPDYSICYSVSFSIISVKTNLIYLINPFGITRTREMGVVSFWFIIPYKLHNRILTYLDDFILP